MNCSGKVQWERAVQPTGVAKQAVHDPALCRTLTADSSSVVDYIPVLAYSSVLHSSILSLKRVSSLLENHRSSEEPRTVP